MSNQTDWLSVPPYGLTQSEKLCLLLPRMEELTRSHYERCTPYRNLVNGAFGGLRNRYERLQDFPFVPAALFKTHELRSVPHDKVVKTLTSSGTTGQAYSRVFLDSETASLQAHVLVKITQFFLGKDRLPMVVVDHPGVTRNRKTFSARAAGILGMMQFGRRALYALKEDMELDIEALDRYVANHAGQRIFLFGFTFMVWEYLVRALEAVGRRVEIPDGILIHSGGWKKLESLRISPQEFKERLEVVSGIKRCVNFYGMVEQVGSVYFENQMGYFHAPAFADVIIRDAVTLQPVPNGQSGLIQTFSALPGSYPGHSVLTQDMGVVIGADSPGLPMKGKYFQVVGRAPAAELRGCSDTYSPDSLGPVS